MMQLTNNCSTLPQTLGFSRLLGPATSRCLVECHPFHHPGPPSTGQGVPAVSAALVGTEDGALCPICQRVADALGDHHVGCGGNGDRILRHDSIRDALFSAAQSAALAPWKEAPSLIPESSSRPADVYLPYWVRGQPAALDVTVISTLQQQTLTGAASVPSHALQVGEDQKMAAHADACRAVGVVFVPLVMETLGGWCDEAIRTIRQPPTRSAPRHPPSREHPTPLSAPGYITVERKCHCGSTANLAVLLL